ncbi:hypothetical protein [Actinoplanes sp. NPDC049265]|uniref:hypothetical protein n=1 Tax=Actinoplanes sp. NPDC049265 TaxID=3363902 RepID=UPI0037235C29
MAKSDSKGHAAVIGALASGVAGVLLAGAKGGVSTPVTVAAIVGLVAMSITYLVLVMRSENPPYSAEINNRSTGKRLGYRPSTRADQDAE